jgi:hypothetical protein
MITVILKTKERIPYENAIRVQTNVNSIEILNGANEAIAGFPLDSVSHWERSGRDPMVMTQPLSEVMRKA